MIAMFPQPLPGTVRTPHGGTWHVWVLAVKDGSPDADPIFLVVSRSGGQPWWDTGVRISRLVPYR